MFDSDPAPDFDTFACSLEALVASIDARDPYTSGHCDRTGRISRALALRLDMGGESLRQLELAAHFHDIGKIGIPDHILHNPGRLEQDDWEVMKTHSALGERIFLASHRPDAAAVAKIIRHHHEAIDGSGYPDRLAGDAIPLAARILRVADTYDAITSRRPYHPGCEHEDAMRLLHAEQDWKIDGDVFREFERLMRDRALQAT